MGNQILKKTPDPTTGYYTGTGVLMRDVNPMVRLIRQYFHDQPDEDMVTLGTVTPAQGNNLPIYTRGQYTHDQMSAYHCNKKKLDPLSNSVLGTNPSTHVPINQMKAFCMGGPIVNGLNGAAGMKQRAGAYDDNWNFISIPLPAIKMKIDETNPSQSVPVIDIPYTPNAYSVELLKTKSLIELQTIAKTYKIGIENKKKPLYELDDKGNPKYDSDHNPINKYKIKYDNKGNPLLDDRGGIMYELDAKGIRIPTYEPIRKEALIELIMSKIYPEFLETDYLGYQLRDFEYTNLTTKYASSTTDSNHMKSAVQPNPCDALLTHHCAKQLALQGCMSIDRQYDTKGIPKPDMYATLHSDRYMCSASGLNGQGRGTPDCKCMNAPLGPSMNTPITDLIPNNYGIDCSKYKVIIAKDKNTWDNEEKEIAKRCTTRETDANKGDISNYTIDMYKVEFDKQRPEKIDLTCARAGDPLKELGVGAAYKTIKMYSQTGSVTCSNVINISDSSISSLMMQSITQVNDCGSIGANMNLSKDEEFALEGYKTESNKIKNDVDTLNNQIFQLNTDISTQKGDIIRDETSFATSNTSVQNTFDKMTSIIQDATNLKTSAQLNTVYNTIQMNQDYIDKYIDSVSNLPIKLNILKNTLVTNNTNINSYIKQLLNLQNEHTLVLINARNDGFSSDMINSIITNDNNISTYVKQIQASDTVNTFKQNVEEINKKIILILNLYNKMKTSRSISGSFDKPDSYKSVLINQIYKMYMNKLMKEEGESLYKDPTIIPFEQFKYPDISKYVFTDYNTFEYTDPNIPFPIAEASLHPDTVSQYNIAKEKAYNAAKLTAYNTDKKAAYDNMIIDAYAAGKKPPVPVSEKKTSIDNSYVDNTPVAIEKPIIKKPVDIVYTQPPPTQTVKTTTVLQEVPPNNTFLYFIILLGIFGIFIFMSNKPQQPQMGINMNPNMNSNGFNGNGMNTNPNGFNGNGMNTNMNSNGFNGNGMNYY